MRTYISNATIVNDGEQFRGSIVINGRRIVEILRGDKQPRIAVDKIIDATGKYLIPGVIDDHVHFREPGLTHKATIRSESRAAAAGGVTSYMEMPNTIPQTTTLTELRKKYAIAAKDSAVNYAFYFGATKKNIRLLHRVNPRTVSGIKLFMGSSTGNMLVDSKENLEKIFQATRLPIAVHCEDTEIINNNIKKITAKKGADPDVKFHPIIRNTKACYNSTKKAIELAKKYGTQLHIMHISTKKELSLLTPDDLYNKKIIAEVTPAHLIFCDEDYKTLGTQIKCNPAIKSKKDRNALRKALASKKIDLIGTDHAPHLPSDKIGGALKAASGMPSIQFSLIAMLQLVNEGIITIEEVVRKMCHNPAYIFDIRGRGYLRRGFFADFVLLDPKAKHTIEKKDIVSLCGWSPFEGRTFDWAVSQTWVNGECVYNEGKFNDNVRGKVLLFRR